MRRTCAGFGVKLGELTLSTSLSLAPEVIPLTRLATNRFVPSDDQAPIFPTTFYLDPLLSPTLPPSPLAFLSPHPVPVPLPHFRTLCNPSRFLFVRHGSHRSRIPQILSHSTSGNHSRTDCFERSQGRIEEVEECYWVRVDSSVVGVLVSVVL